MKVTESKYGVYIIQFIDDFKMNARYSKYHAPTDSYFEVVINVPRVEWKNTADGVMWFGYPEAIGDSRDEITLFMERSLIKTIKESKYREMNK